MTEPGTAIPEETMVLLTEKCSEQGCTRRRFSELTDDQNTHWHVRRGSALVPLAAALPHLGPVVHADTDGRSVLAEIERVQAENAELRALPRPVRAWRSYRNSRSDVVQNLHWAMEDARRAVDEANRAQAAAEAEVAALRAQLAAVEKVLTEWEVLPESTLARAASSARTALAAARPVPPVQEQKP